MRSNKTQLLALKNDLKGIKDRNSDQEKALETENNKIRALEKMIESRQKNIDILIEELVKCLILHLTTRTKEMQRY